jgi:hypothetical protein
MTHPTVKNSLSPADRFALIGRAMRAAGEGAIHHPSGRLNEGLWYALVEAVDDVSSNSRPYVQSVAFLQEVAAQRD